ncbi:GLPGLI family protein [Polaribacter sp. R77954]|uniref:GLPGLI family protein n=1 Tax=Polaribacter sp. R77954 TaxID=3093870 RepID=UPI0037C696EE
MKIKITLILFLITSILFSQKKYSKVIYKKKSILKIKNKNDNADILLNKTFSKMDELEYILQFNKDISIFKENEKLSIGNTDNSLPTKLSKIMGGGSGVFYTELKEGNIYHQKEFESDIFLIKLSKQNNWVLTQEKKQIGDYTCYKATKKDFFIGSSGNSVEIKIKAWYAPELPYSFGPLKYNGLPGLILEIENDKVIFYASKIILNQSNGKELKKVDKGIKITQKEYDSITSGLAKDFREKYNRN